MYLQYAIIIIGRIISWPNTSQPGLLPLLQWYVERTAKSAAARIPIHGPESSTYVSCRLYVSKSSPSTLCILSIIEFAYVFPEESILVLITYSSSIRLFLKL